MKYYAVIFRTIRDLPVSEEYSNINQRLFSDVKELDGFIDIFSVGDDQGRGLSISYWKSLEAIKDWKNKKNHLEAQERGKTEWYKYYKVEICEVLRSYDGGTGKK